MSNENYLTVAEYAAAKHITKQAVYKQLNKGLKQFLVVVDGQKFIDKAALGDSVETELNKGEQPFEQPLNNQIQPFLQAQLEEKDRTIERLLRQIESLSQQNERLTDLLHNSQVLLAAEKQQQLITAQTESEEQPTEPQEEKKRNSIFSFLKRKNK